ncbi:PIN2 TERF1-interacting telomerase inhibitor 1 [Pelobates cultripes]|uniref:PIN2 TERF1-interacting telomerase inhibitor 1 n=1 Tax=Pelobates cultripes TaxID=61616 RepID=A0AAD1VNI1_PELCU|nr:PIN2 TERF1-interacting telomerase inhibitor 1 [Pelobates cultripes]
MAMLAEPRRKQKWSVDPRNSAWSKDESKFGQKMLEKMGWSKGKGLGAQEQGSVDHIKVQVKNNSFGLGASVKHEDNWIAHQDDFNQILAELNDCHGTPNPELSQDNEKKTFSLEEKSKSSRKRVHYMKFAKGKDLSCRTDTDLACIFGKREKSEKTTQQEESEVESDEQAKDQSPSEDYEPGNTVTSTLSVNEYFAKRMAEFKKSQANRTQSAPLKIKECSVNSSENSSEDTKHKSKKKKRNKQDGNIESDCLKETEVIENLENDINQTATKSQLPKKKSKKKEIKSEDTKCIEEEDDAQASDNEFGDEKPQKRKKKNKRNKEERPEHSKEKDGDSPTKTEKPKKKKKKKRSA